MDNEEMLAVIKSIFEKKTEEIKMYVDERMNGQSLLIESLRSDIKAVAEGHEVLNRKIDDKADEVKAGIKTVADYVAAVDAKLKEHEVILKRAK